MRCGAIVLHTCICSNSMSWTVANANHEERVSKTAVLNGAHPTTFHVLLHTILPDNSSHDLTDLLCLCYLRVSTILFSCLTRGEQCGQILHNSILPTGKQHNPFNIQNN